MLLFSREPSPQSPTVSRDCLFPNRCTSTRFYHCSHCCGSLREGLLTSMVRPPKCVTPQNPSSLHVRNKTLRSSLPMWETLSLYHSHSWDLHTQGWSMCPAHGNPGFDPCNCVVPWQHQQKPLSPELGIAPEHQQAWLKSSTLKKKKKKNAKVFNDVNHKGVYCC